MATYRLFFIGHDNHIVRAGVVDCPTDNDAVAAARLSGKVYRAVEVWQLGRFINRIEVASTLDRGVS